MLHLWQKTTPLLDAHPPTPEESEWWEEARKPLRRRTYLRAAPIGVVPALLPLVRHGFESSPTALWILVPVAALFGIGAALAIGCMTWRSTERLELQSQLAGRRIRERLVAEAAADDSPDAASAPARVC